MAAEQTITIERSYLWGAEICVLPANRGIVGVAPSFGTPQARSGWARMGLEAARAKSCGTRELEARYARACAGCRCSGG
jgi:hypothetical protein